MAGWKLRGYTVEQLLGRGASSEVWRARVAGNGEPVALKRLLLTDADQVRRAHGEAALLSVLDHPNLVRLHDVVSTPDAAVLVLDLADGGSLADLLAARGRLTPGETITALAPVAAALAYVHRHAVVHGDVSPANVLFTRGGVALLADLGVSRLTGDESNAESTLAYLDPGVAVGGAPTTASDVYMLGAVALHALTGEPLWSGGSVASLLAAASRGDTSAALARLATAGVPDGMAAVIRRALDQDVPRRGTAADFALDLRHSGTPVAVELRAGRPLLAPDHGGAVMGGGAVTGGGVVMGGAAVTIGGDEPPQPGQTSPKLRRGGAGPPYAPRHAAGSMAARRVAAVADRAGPRGSAVCAARVGEPDLHSAGTVGQSAAPRVAAAARVGNPALRAAGAAGAGGAAGAAGEPAAPRRGRLPPTIAVQRARPELPVRAGRRPGRWTARRAAVLGAVVVLLVAGVIAGFRLVRSDGGMRQTAARVDWTAELRSVDRLRARAYAERDPGLMSRVYPAGPLRREDAARLRQIVPVGCSLRGAGTRYSNVSVTPRPRNGATARASLRATARIPAALLHCPDRTDRRLAAVGPTRLRIELVRDRSGARIVDLAPL